MGGILVKRDALKQFSKERSSPMNKTRYYDGTEEILELRSL